MASDPPYQELLAAAKLADVNWRTVRSFFRGEPMRTSTRARVVKALKLISQKKGQP